MKPGKKTFLFLLSFLLLIASQTALSQKRIDSLLNLAESEHSIERKAQYYLKLGEEYKSTDLQKSEQSAKLAMLIVDEDTDKKTAALIHVLLGDIAYRQDSLNKAEKEYKLAIPLLNEAKELKKLIQIFINLGNRFIEKGDYPQAMDYYLKGLGMTKEINDTIYLPNLYNNLGVVYINLNEYKKALDYYAKALPLFEKLNDSINMAGTTANIGSIYIQMEEYDIARQYYKKGFEIFQRIGLIGGQAHVLFKLGLLDKIRNQYDDALQNLLKSKQLQELNEPVISGSKSMFLAETNIHIGIVYYLLKEYNTAEAFLQSGLAASKEGGQLELIALASEYLSKRYKQKDDFKKAFEYYILFKTYSDSTFNIKNSRKLSQLELQYQFDVKLKEAELKSLAETQKRKRMSLIYAIITVGLLLILVIVALLLKLEKKKKKAVVLERQRLSDQLDHTNKELTTQVMYLLKKNEFILTIIEKLKKARLAATAENKKVMTELIAELKSNTDSISWEEFELRFQKVHTDFYTRLSQQFPDLSTNELRLCAFFKLNMTSKEIAAFTYQSLNSIKVARYRLRKKLKLEKSENLVTFLNRF